MSPITGVFMSDNNFQDTLFIRALRRCSTPRPPLWLMRQAGRYLPEYRRLRADAGDFLTLVKTPSLAAEATLQPIRRFDFDAAIIFSDILIVAEAMRLGLRFIEGEGPRIDAPIVDEAAVARLPAADAENYRYVFDACTETRRALPTSVPLIGFAGAPFTLACYCIDGGGGGFWRARAMLHARPDLLHTLLTRLADAVAGLLIGQATAGCQALMIFDSWGGLLTDRLYQHFSLPYIRRIVAAVKQATAVPVIVFARQAALSLPAIAACGCDAVGIDWQTSPATAKRLCGDQVALQGNLDPAVLLTTPEAVQAAAAAVIEEFAGAAGHIFNLGHGIDKTTPLENVAALAEAVAASAARS